jgi:hypothetical protein
MNVLFQTRLMRGLNSARIDVAQPLIKIVNTLAFGRFHMQTGNTTFTTRSFHRDVLKRLLCKYECIDGRDILHAQSVDVHGVCSYKVLCILTAPHAIPLCGTYGQGVTLATCKPHI